MNDKYLKVLKKLADYSEKLNEVPVGAIIVCDEKIIAGSYNSMERDKSSLSHAEIKAIKTAQKKLKNWRLNNCKIYVSLEPCVMCSGAIHFSRIKNVTFLASSNDYALSDLPFDIEIINLDDEIYKKQLKDFFKRARNKSKI
jgi:tRNA(adenine34) deaminase